MKQSEKLTNLLELMQANPELPVIPCVDGDVVRRLRPLTRKRCGPRHTSSVDMYQKPKTVCSAMAAIIVLAGSTVLMLSSITSIAPIAGPDLRTERRKNRELCMKFVKSGYDLKVIEESV